MRARHSLFVIVALVLIAPVALAQKKSPVNGDWEASVGSQTFRFSFSEEDGDVRGSVRLPSGQTVAVEYGLVLGKELEFTTSEDGVEYEWTAEVGRNSIKGERVNIEDESSVRFTAKRIR